MKNFASFAVFVAIALSTMPGIVHGQSTPNRGFLKVGVSNDYPPFSTVGDGVSRTVASWIAQDLGYSGPLFVDFDWPDLEAAVRRGDFDFALSGITWRNDRALVGWMSPALAWGGPCLLAAREWPPSSGSPAKIAVNRGGFLERWARDVLMPRLAEQSGSPGIDLSTVDDNLELPHLLAQGQVLAIVTDSYEIRSFAAEVPESESICEPPGERKVLWLAPGSLELKDPLESWLLKNRHRMIDLLARGGSKRLAPASPRISDLPMAESLVAADAAALWNDVLDLIARRLSYMPEVGRIKAQRGQAIEDLEREAVVLEATAAKAEDLGLDSVESGRLFQFLMDWAKQVQAQQTGSPADPPFDLERQIRPALIELGDRILEALQRAIDADSSATSLRLETLNGAVLSPFFPPATNGDQSSAQAEVLVSHLERLALATARARL